MQTPILTSSPSAPPDTAAKAPGAATESTDNGQASFSQVLDSQRTATEAPAGTPDAGTTQAASLRTEARLARDEAASTPSDAILATLAAEQGLSLPQIALNLAIQSRAVQSGTESPSGASDAPADLPVGGRYVAENVLRAPVADLPVREAPALPLAEQAPEQADTRQTVALPLPAIANAEQDIRIAAAKPEVVAAITPRKVVTAHGGPEIAPTAQAGLLPAVSAAGVEPLASHPVASAVPAGIGIDATANAAAGLNASTPQASLLPAAPAPVTTAAVQATLHSPQWPSEFGRQVVSLAQSADANRPHTAELRLDPPELGPVRITINLSDNVAHAMFVSPHASVRQAIENALGSLQQQLAQSGISLGQTSVSDQGQSSSFADAFGQGNGNGKGQAASGQAGSDRSGESSAATIVRSRPASNTLVDTFA